MHWGSYCLLGCFWHGAAASLNYSQAAVLCLWSWCSCVGHKERHHPWNDQSEWKKLQTSLFCLWMKCLVIIMRKLWTTYRSEFEVFLGVMLCPCVSLCVCVCVFLWAMLQGVWEPQGSRMQCTGFLLFVWRRVCGIHAVRLRDHLCSAQEASGQTTAISAYSLSSHFPPLPSFS